MRYFSILINFRPFLINFRTFDRCNKPKMVKFYEEIIKNGQNYLRYVRKLTRNPRKKITYGEITYVTA